MLTKNNQINEYILIMCYYIIKKFKSKATTPAYRTEVLKNTCASLLLCNQQHHCLPCGRKAGGNASLHVLLYSFDWLLLAYDAQERQISHHLLHLCSLLPCGSGHALSPYFPHASHVDISKVYKIILQNI